MTATDYTNVVEDDAYTTASNPMPQSQPQPKATKSRFNILSANDALQPQPQVKYIVEDVVAEGSVNMVFGDSGSKKTLSIIDMVTCVAKGCKWLKFNTSKSNVLFIDEDNGPRRMLRRLGESLRGHNADEQTPIYCLSYSGFDFSKDEDIGYLKTWIMATGAGLVIIDVLASVMPGKDENAVKDTQPVFQKLRHAAQETNAAIILIHHTNKSGGYRGSSAIKGALETMIFVESKQGSDLITFKAEKTRDEAWVNFSANIQFENLDPKKFWLIASQKPVKQATMNTYNKAEKFVLLYLFNNGESVADDITGSIDPYVDPAPKSVSNAISKLKGDGIIERTDKGGMGTSGKYQLTTLGNLEAENL